MEAYDSRDFTIHLKDAALYILMRWKWLLSASLAGAILLTAAQYVMDIGRYRSDTSAIVTLTAEERAHVAAALSYEAAYRRLCTYNEGAPLMHIDPAAAPTRQMRLLVTGENARAAAGLYREFMTAQALYREVAEEGVPTAYMVDLVTLTVENEMMPQPSRQVFLSVQVVAPTEEICARLSAVVYRLAQEEQTAVAEAVGAHTARWVVDRYAVVRDETLSARQQASFEEQTRLGEQAAAARQGLTAQELEVYRRQLEGVSEEKTPPPAVSRRAWLWGFLLGGGIGLVALSVGYLFCGRVLSAADVTSRHKVMVLGVIGKGGLLRDAAEDSALVWRRLAVTAQRKNVTRLFVSAESEDGWGDLCAVLGGYGITLSVGASPTTDGGGAQTLAACDGCVLALRWGVARHDRVAQEIALARQWDIPVLGILLLQ